ncbi:MAG: methionyl-tRNA formyltransferase [Oscillospiraceae bacterium]|nr:methionyl-tRNA formyltransferase [Candidatus Ruminococcus equi]
MKVIFMGTPDFAVPCLESIINEGHSILGVFTQPDKPKGRKQILTPSDVKVCAQSYNLPIYQPTTLKDGTAFEIIKELQPDVIVVAAYGKILPKEIIDFPKYGCINVHASILPKYRGASPIQHAVLNGDTETGVTTMQMDVGLDTGDILLCEKLPIDIDDTSLSMFEKLSKLGANLIVKTLKAVENQEIKPIKQDDSKATYTKMIDKSMCDIDFAKSAIEVHNLVRGLYYWPIANTYFEGKKLKIFKTKLSDLKGNPGEVLSVNPLVVGCADNSVEILELQLEGKKRMDAKSFLAGHNINIGYKF